jgi:MFS family permease
MHLGDKLGFRAGRVDSLVSMYWNIFLRGMGTAMMGLFVPIYIYLIGNELGGLIFGLRLVVVYVVVQRFLLFLMTIPMARVVERLGFRLSVLLGNFLLVVYYLMPIFGGEKIWVVVVMALISVVSIPLYWLSRHSVLAVDGRDDKFGKEVGMVTLLDRGAGVLAPVVGGVVATVFGFHALFAMGAVVVMVSCVPLFYMKHHDKDGKISWKSFGKWLRDKNKRHLWKGFLGEGMDGLVTSFYWPIYVFVVLGSMEILGGITSISYFAAMVTTYLAGRLFDKKRALGGLEDEKAYWIAGSWFSILRFLRAAVSGLGGLFGVDIVSRVLSGYYWVPYGGYLYSAGKKDGGLKLYAYREMVYSLAIVMAGVLIWIVLMYWWRWWGIFGISAVGVMLTLGMAKES